MVSPSYGTPAEHPTDIAAVHAVYEAFSRRDLDAALPYFWPDATFMVPGTASAVGRDGPYRGHEGIAEYFADIARVWEHLEMHPHDVRAVAGSIIVFGEVHGRTTAGQDVRRRVVWSWRLCDGRVISVQANDVGPAAQA